MCIYKYVYRYVYIGLTRPYRLIFEWAWRRKERALALETQQVCAFRDKVQG